MTRDYCEQQLADVERDLKLCQADLDRDDRSPGWRRSVEGDIVQLQAARRLIVRVMRGLPVEQLSLF